MFNKSHLEKPPIKENITGLKATDSPVFVTTKLTALTDGKIPYHVNDATGLADGPTKTDVDDAVTKKHANTLDHTQGTDTALGTMAADINMGTHQVTALSVPDAAGEAIRQTAKITEAALEALVDNGDSGMIWAIVFGG